MAPPAPPPQAATVVEIFARASRSTCTLCRARDWLFVNHTRIGEPRGEIPIRVSYGCPDPEKTSPWDCFCASGGGTYTKSENRKKGERQIPSQQRRARGGYILIIC